MSEMLMLTRLRRLRKLCDVTLDEIAQETGLSVGYLNRIERGFIADVKNLVKKKRLENCILRLERLAKKSANLGNV